MPKVVDKRPLFPGMRWLLAAIVFCIVDQISKWSVLSTIQLNEIKPIFPGFQLTLMHNRGIAYSWFHDQAEWGLVILISVIIALSLMIGGWLLRTPSNQKWEGIALSLIFGGAMGNLFDRFWHGHVIDFVSLYYQQYYWYVFNLADVFITIGAIMLLKEVFMQREVCQTKNP